ncbi:MAG: hypothetical protein OXU26_10470, partial [Acidobacteriota bacterium]|nr:hypothetical protein [Acidobacteriota bacterium]
MATDAGASHAREPAIQTGNRVSPPPPFASFEEKRLIVCMNLNHKILQTPQFVNQFIGVHSCPFVVLRFPL